MKNMQLMAVALFAAVAGSLSAHEEVVAKKDAACATLTAEEQAFASTLSEGHRKLFCLMSAEQKKASIAAVVETANADHAVDKVLKNSHVAAHAEVKTDKK